MTTYSESDVKSGIDELLKNAGLTWDEFLELGKSDSLIDIDPALDFAFKALVPLMGPEPKA